jgi:hypothetical protein
VYRGGMFQGGEEHLQCTCGGFDSHPLHTQGVSLVAGPPVWDREIAGSNPAPPTAVSMAKWSNASDCESEYREFKSHWTPHAACIEGTASLRRLPGACCELQRQGIWQVSDLDTLRQKQTRKGEGHRSE